MMETYESTTIRMSQPGSQVCILVQDLLPLYLEGEVSPGSRDMIVDHLGHCERCAGYLAGAQSVRTQLRRDLAQHAVVSAAAVPEQRALRRWQRLLVVVVVCIICMVGGMASMGLASGLRYSLAAPATASMIMGMGAFTALLLLARTLGPFTLSRLWQISAGVGTGIIAGFVLINSSGGAAVPAGLLLAIVAMAIVTGAVQTPHRDRVTG